VNIFEAMRTALSEIRAHKLRSMLTLTGIVLGTTALVIMVSVIGGVAVAIEKGFEDLGFDGVVFVSSETPADPIEQKKQHYSHGLRVADLAVISSGRELVEAAAPAVRSRETARIDGRDYEVEIEGITPSFGIVRNRSVAVGRYITDSDVAQAAPVCVLGDQLKQDAFGTQDAVGREIVVRDLRLRVVGVLPRLGSSQIQMRRDNRRIYAPLSTVQKQLLGSDAVHYYAFKIGDPERLSDGEKEVAALLRRSHRGITDFEVENIGEEILRIRSEVDVLLDNWTIVLATIAGISLLVGGIGISERLFEIGLRKAIGASDRSIFFQFLIESVSLSVVGGLIGSLLGYALTLAVGQVFEDGLAVSSLGLLLAGGFAVFVGLAAGVYPALRAASLEPVEAIRGV
jgi:putative ABC transport system permease protein